MLVRDQYDDGGISGGTLERPGLQRLMADIEDGLVDVVVVYKIDRLSRALADFAKLVEVFDRNGVTFVLVTQSFNTTMSMGRLTLTRACPPGVVSLENCASSVLSSAASACSINCRAPVRIRSVSGSVENPFGSGKTVMGSRVMWHIPFSARMDGA